MSHQNDDSEEDDYMSAEVLEAMSKLEQAQKKARGLTPSEMKKQRSAISFFSSFILPWLIFPC